MATGMFDVEDQNEAVEAAEAVEVARWTTHAAHDDRVCRAVAQAADLARSIAYGRDYAAHFTDRLNDHLRETGIALPARLGGYWVECDGDGGFRVRRAG